MTRRDWLLSAAALLQPHFAATAAGALSPLDEATFRRVVSAHHGRILLVDFWATWCAPCRDEMPKLIALEAAKKGEGLDLITISCDDPDQEAAATQFLNAHNAPQPGYVKHAKSDDDFINSIDPKWSGALPGIFIYDRNGQQIQSFIGETDMKLLGAAVTKALASKI